MLQEQEEAKEALKDLQGVYVETLIEYSLKYGLLAIAKVLYFGFILLAKTIERKK